MHGRIAIQLLRTAPSEEGPQIDALLIEPNGDAHPVRCLCRPDGTTEIGEAAGSGMLMYLTERYGPQVVFALREAAMRAA